MAHREAHRRQRLAKGAVHLVTPATTTRIYQLREHRGRIERHRPAEVNVEILVRNRQQMRAMHGGERLECQVERTVVGNASEVTLQVVDRE